MELFQEKKKKIVGIILGTIVSLVLLGIFLFYYLQKTTSPFETFSSETFFSTSEVTSTASSEKNIFVDVKGAVKNPGVYEVSFGARAFEVIQKAGGLEENADEKQINQAQILTDQQMLYVPLVGEEIIFKEETEKESSETSLVNINTADLTELMTLPGIGEKKATAIMEHRENQGTFAKIEGLMEVTGIGEVTFTNLKELITIK